MNDGIRRGNAWARRGNAWAFVKEIPQGTAERIYAADFLRYRLAGGDDMPRWPEPNRPDVREYNLGVRVTDHLREEIDRILDGA